MADPTSKRTHQRATALALLRGCDQLNDCWRDCYEAAHATVEDGRMSSWGRAGIGRIMGELYGPKEGS